MSSARSPLAIAAIALFVAFSAAAAEPVNLDRVTVTGRAETRENAIIDAEQSAVALVTRRTIGVRAWIEQYEISEQERQDVVALLMPHSKMYLHTFEIIDDRIDAAGLIEITALVRVDVDRVVITLRNLNLAE